MASSDEDVVAMIVDCATGLVGHRPLTQAERADREADRDASEVARADREAREVQARADREALGSWLLSRDDLTDAVRAAILRALESNVSISRSIEGGTNG